jgi:hypothetical protein
VRVKDGQTEITNGTTSTIAIKKKIDPKTKLVFAHFP